MVSSLTDGWSVNNLGRGNAAIWINDAALFSRNFRVLAVDLIGAAGFSAPSRPPIGSDAYALWLDDVLDGLNIRSAMFAGISLGGWMALDYAIRRAERVDRLGVDHARARDRRRKRRVLRFRGNEAPT